jgi:hypothetical protein
MYLGLNMATFATSKIIFCALSPTILKYIKRIYGCFIGAFLIITYLFGFGLLYFMEDQNLIIATSFVFSVLGGAGNGINATSTVAILNTHKD